MDGVARRSRGGTSSADGIGLAKELAEAIVTRAEAASDASTSSRLVLVLDDYMYSAQVSLVQRKFRRLVEVFFAWYVPVEMTYIQWIYIYPLRKPLSILVICMNICLNMLTRTRRRVPQ